MPSALLAQRGLLKGSSSSLRGSLVPEALDYFQLKVEEKDVLTRLDSAP